MKKRRDCANFLTNEINFTMPINGFETMTTSSDEDNTLLCICMFYAGPDSTNNKKLVKSLLINQVSTN